jgi:hypothetical protein
MKSTFAIVVLAIPLALAGCTPGPRMEVVSTPINVEELAPYGRPAKTRIEGQAFMVQRGGGVVTCAGNPVYLIPATDFFSDAIRSAARGAVVGISESEIARLDEVHHRINQTPGATDLIHTARCDATERFRFQAVAARPWIAVTLVRWDTFSRDGRAFSQGGMLTQEFMPLEGRTTEIILSNDDRARR